MDSNIVLISILIALVFLLLLIVGGLVFYIVFNKQKKEPAEEKEFQDPTEQLRDLFESQKTRDEPKVGVCSICEKELTKKEHYEVEKLHFCKDHFNLYTQSNWVQITNQKTTAETPEAGIYIYDFKKTKWEQDKEPMYIQCEYKIDFNGDNIETYVQLYVLEQNQEELKKKLEAGK